ncbi:hypothetical protein [Methanosarcina sp. UBA289]
MTIAWAGTYCSNPPCISISLRKATYSYPVLWKTEHLRSAFRQKNI